MKKCLISFSAALAVTAVAAAARATDYYVATNGGASAAGTMAAPWTMAKAVGSSGAGPGDTVYVRGGTYNGAVNFSRSGNSGAWITFRAFEGELPIFQGSGGSGVSSSTAQYVRFIGIAVRNFTSSGFGNGWVNDTGTSNGNLQFINCIADNNGINGIAFYNASGILIENSIIAHNGNGSPSQSWSSGVNLFHVAGGATANIVRGNVSFENIDISAHHSDGSGYILDQMSDGATFANNIGFHNGGSCIRLTNSSGALIVNNTCWHNGLEPSDAQGAPANPGEIYFSNPITANVVAFANNLGAASGYNNTQQAWGGSLPSGGGQNNYAVNANGATPFWVNPAALDFHLVAGSTTVIDKGTTTNAPTNDIGFDGKCITMARPAAVTGQQAPPSWWAYSIDYAYIQSIGGVGACFRPSTRTSTPDIGAFEYGGTISTGTGGTGGTVGTAGTSGGTGTAGTSGTGAAGTSGTGTAGTIGTGTAGVSGTGTGGRGGTTGTGGSIGTGTAGVSGTGTGGRGGTSGTGGTIGTGVAGVSGTGSAGSVGSGAAGNGVVTGTAGATGTAGTTGAGTGSGGSSINTGTAGAGALGTAGSVGTGSAGTGVVTGSGGSSSTGTGGVTGTAGTTGTGTGNGGTGTGGDTAGGCACQSGGTGSTGFAVLSIFGLTLLRRRRRYRNQLRP